VSKQKSSTIGGIAGPHGNPAQCGHDGGFNGILKEKRQVELFFSELRTELHEATRAVVSPLFVINEQSIAARMMAQQFCNRRVRGDHDFSLGKSRPHPAHGGSGHYRVPDPIGRTNEYLPDVRRV
jgi:hypothetical protein